MLRVIPAVLVLGTLLATESAMAQGRLPRVEGHYVGALDFFNTQAGARHRVPHPDPSQNGLQGNGDGWIGDDSVQVRGLMQGAQLNVDWWTLFAEPVANYTFVWQSSGYYDIQYTDPKKGRVAATVTREELTKYPALLKRFDRLKPVETAFEIRWRIGDQTSADREKFKDRHRLFGSIGSAAPHVKTTMTTRLHDGMLIYEPAGGKPFSTPASPVGGWKDFGSLPDSFSSKQTKMLADYFNISTGQVVNGFRATKFRWPLGEMKAIAESLARIKAGGEPPSPVEEAEKETARPLAGYAARDEWADAAPPPLPAEPPVPKYDAQRRTSQYLKSNGQLAFPGEFSSAEQFYGGYAIVELPVPGRPRTVLDLRGKPVLPKPMERVHALVYHSSGPAGALFWAGQEPGQYTKIMAALGPTMENRLGVWDARGQRWLIPAIYAAYEVLKETSKDFIEVEVWRYLSVSPPRWELRNNLRSFYCDAQIETVRYRITLEGMTIQQLDRRTSTKVIAAKWAYGRDWVHRNIPRR